MKPRITKNNKGEKLWFLVFAAGLNFLGMEPTHDPFNIISKDYRTGRDSALGIRPQDQQKYHCTVILK